MNFFSAFLEMFRNSDQFIAHMSAEYGIYVYLFLFTVYFFLNRNCDFCPPAG